MDELSNFWDTVQLDSVANSEKNQAIWQIIEGFR